MEDLCALLVPTEKPPTDVDLKRALLLFDQVRVFDPSDREIFAPHLWMQAIFEAPLPMHVNTGPVLPLGKLPGHDERFADAIDSCRDAIDQGVLCVEQAPAPSPGITLGAAPRIAGRGHPRPILSVLRQLTSSRDYLLDVVKGVRLEELETVDPAALVPDGQALRVQGPPVAQLQDGSISNKQAETLQALAAARLGSLVKCVDAAEIRGLHLYSTDDGVHTAISRMSASTLSTLAGLLGDEERRTVERAVRVERIVADMFLPDATLGAMSVKQVLGLRTKAWGRHGETRAAFFRQVRVLSHDCGTDVDFDSRVRSELEAYARAAEELNHSWKTWGLRVAAKGGTAIASGHVFGQILAVESWATLATVAAVAAAKIVEKEGPALLDLWRGTTKNRVGAGRALAMPYRQMKR